MSETPDLTELLQSSLDAILLRKHSCPHTGWILLTKTYTYCWNCQQRIPKS